MDLQEPMIDPTRDESLEPDDETKAARSLYLDLMKRALTHTLYWPPDVFSLDELTSDKARKAELRASFAGAGIDVARARAEGRDWPRYAQTMVGLRRLENVQYCVEDVIARGVPGDLIEAGVWRGGVAIMMRAVLKAHGVVDRKVFAADSFCGLPIPDPDRYPADALDPHHAIDALRVTRARVKRNFGLYGLFDDQVVLLEGWFRDTLPDVRARQWAIVRLDGDMYESTMDSLVNLYPGLAVGGYLIVDDFAHPACRQAVEDFRAANKIGEPIREIDWTGAFWQRETLGTS